MIGTWLYHSELIIMAKSLLFLWICPDPFNVDCWLLSDFLSFILYNTWIGLYWFYLAILVHDEFLYDAFVYLSKVTWSLWCIGTRKWMISFFCHHIFWNAILFQEKIQCFDPFLKILSITEFRWFFVSLIFKIVMN